MRSIFTSIFLSAIFIVLTSHEFWLSPRKFIYKRGEKINVRFLVGENFSGENWKGNNSKIKSLRLFYGGVSDDLSEYITDAEGDSIELTILDEGTNLIAFNSTNSFIELEPTKFNEYLTEDGLHNAILYRNKHNEGDSIGREYYQRCAKTLIQVGPVKDKTYSIETGMPIDIIPAANPYSLNDEDSLKVKIMYRDELLPGALIKIWQWHNNSFIKKELMTDENGEITFSIPTKGKWMISTVKIERLEEDPKAQWQSYWGSLTWGYE